MPDGILDHNKCVKTQGYGVVMGNIVNSCHELLSKKSLCDANTKSANLFSELQAAAFKSLSNFNYNTSNIRNKSDLFHQNMNWDSTKTDLKRFKQGMFGNTACNWLPPYCGGRMEPWMNRGVPAPQSYNYNSNMYVQIPYGSCGLSLPSQRHHWSYPKHFNYKNKDHTSKSSHHNRKPTMQKGRSETTGITKNNKSPPVTTVEQDMPVKKQSEKNGGELLKNMSKCSKTHDDISDVEIEGKVIENHESTESMKNSFLSNICDKEYRTNTSPVPQTSADIRTDCSSNPNNSKIHESKEKFGTGILKKQCSGSASMNVSVSQCNIENAKENRDFSYMLSIRCDKEKRRSAKKRKRQKARQDNSGEVGDIKVSPSDSENSCGESKSANVELKDTFSFVVGINPLISHPKSELSSNLTGGSDHSLNLIVTGDYSDFSDFSDDECEIWSGTVINDCLQDFDDPNNPFSGGFRVAYSVQSMSSCPNLITKANNNLNQSWNVNIQVEKLQDKKVKKKVSCTIFFPGKYYLFSVCISMDSL